MDPWTLSTLGELRMRRINNAARCCTELCAPPPRGPWCGSCMGGRELALTKDRAVWCSVPSPASRSTKTPHGGGSRAAFRGGLVNMAVTCHVFFTGPKRPILSTAHCF